MKLSNLPFNGSWLTFWGGNTAKQNHHHDTPSQKYAFDFIATDENGKFFRTDGKTCEDYFAFGQDILAPADCVVNEVVQGLRDNKPGELNSFNFIGNYIMLKHDNGYFSVLGHLRQDSTLVAVGQSVRAGSKVAECGNSGYTTDPHLHFHVQDSAVFAKMDKDYNRIDIAKGQKVTFNKITAQIGKSASEVKLNHSPVKGEVVSNRVE